MRLKASDNDIFCILMIFIPKKAITFLVFEMRELIIDMITFKGKTVYCVSKLYIILKKFYYTENIIKNIITFI